MSESPTADEPHFLSHPDARATMKLLFAHLVDESDRGAVLIAAAEVDGHLRKLFEQTASKHVSKKDLKRVLDYPGPLSTVAARADVARMTHLISESVYQSIQQLRKIRNDVAHSPQAFNLRDHQERIKKIYELGDNVPGWISRMTLDFVFESYLHKVLEIRDPSDETKPAFSSAKEVIDHLLEMPDVIAMLEERRFRLELALGTTLLCALIVVQRDKAMARRTRAGSTSRSSDSAS